MRMPLDTHAESPGENLPAARQGEAPVDDGAIAPGERVALRHRALGALVKLAAVAALAAGGLWGLLLDLELIAEAVGLWGVVAGLVAAPLTVAATPLYALFALGDWLPMVSSYGSSIASALMFYAGAAMVGE